MIRSLVLFVHIVGVLALFAGLAIERFGVDAVRRVAARISGLAVAVTVASGVAHPVSWTVALPNYAAIASISCRAVAGVR
jgi:hypothetical protein